MTTSTTKTLSVKNMTLISMFAAILAILTQISIPLPGGVAMTLQTFGVALIGIILGWRLGGLSVLLYLLLGLIGLPVFSLFRGGPSILLGFSGGYLIGFLFMVLVIGLGQNKKTYLCIMLSIIGLLLCHAAGLTWYYFLTKTFLVYTPIMLIKDIVSVILAVIIGKKVKKVISL